MTNKTNKKIPGKFVLVLHTHLPLYAKYGGWPVGEEWLYQAWANSYLRMFNLINTLDKKNKKNVFSMSITPVLLSQLNSTYSIENMHYWIGNLKMRSQEAININIPNGWYFKKLSEKYLYLFEKFWLNGINSSLRKWQENSTIEFIQGPANHTFQPLLPKKLRTNYLKYGQKYLENIFPKKLEGIWPPELSFKKNMEKEYEENKIKYFMVDGPAFDNDTGFGRKIYDSNVIAFARNMKLSYELWSPNTGYPGHSEYLDFHSVHNDTGLKIFKVTDKSLPYDKKDYYDPDETKKRLEIDVEKFIKKIESHLINEFEKNNQPGIVIAAFDTELFGHWWHEGPEWLELLFQKLEEKEIDYGTLKEAYQENYISNQSFDLPNTSWGLNKNWSIWNSEKTKEINLEANKNIKKVQEYINKIYKKKLTELEVKKINGLTRELALQLSSDWAFMISHDSSTQYAKERVFTHSKNINTIIENNNSTQNEINLIIEKNNFNEFFNFKDFI